MGKAFRAFSLVIIFVALTGVSRSCNLFEFFSEADGDESMREDVRMSVRQHDWATACSLTKELQANGRDTNNEMRKSINDGLAISIFGTNTFLAAVQSGSVNGLICAAKEAQAGDACSNTDCQDATVTNSCSKLLKTDYSNLVTFVASNPQLSCAATQVACADVANYAGNPTGTGAAAALARCKQAIADSPSACTSIYASSCTSATILSPCAGGSVGVNVCTAGCATNVGDGTVAAANFQYDETWVVMTSDVSCD